MVKLIKFLLEISNVGIKLMGKFLFYISFLTFTYCFVFNVVYLNNNSVSFAKTIHTKEVVSYGACAITNMNEKQAQHLALQQARARAVEKALGIEIISKSIVTNGNLILDFIKTYSKGIIINEKQTWLPLKQYQADISKPPIPEYHVRINAEVYCPQKRIPPLGLNAKLNNYILHSACKKCENYMEIQVLSRAKILIFNIRSDDIVVKIYPCNNKDHILFPKKVLKLNYTAINLPGNQIDFEAMMICAVDLSYLNDTYFDCDEEYKFSNFFNKYSIFSDYCEETILPYKIVSNF